MITSTNIDAYEPQSGIIPFSIKRVKRDELLELVSIALKEDEDLINKYHFQDSNTEEMILNNLKNIDELAQTKEVKLYGIYTNDTPIGFSVISEKLLYSFGINVYCRQSAIVLEWLKWLKEIVFKEGFMVCLYKENTRAINFFLRNGLEELSEDEKVVYLFNRKN